MKVSSWHIGIAAEAFAAGLFARNGYNVSVQYGANQPEYDLFVEKGSDILKVSVKGSQTGSWGLIQSYKKGNTYYEAADKWAETHSKRTVLCLVQFYEVDEVSMPRVYLALPSEIADLLKRSRNGNGETILYENHTWKSGIGKGVTDKIPENWRFSADRIYEIVCRMYEEA